MGLKQPGLIAGQVLTKCRIIVEAYRGFEKKYKNNIETGLSVAKYIDRGRSFLIESTPYVFDGGISTWGPILRGDYH